MDWYKSKVCYTLYSDLNDKQFRAYHNLMALTSQIEAIPSREQMLKVCHIKTLESLEKHFETRKTTLLQVLSKVLCDVHAAIKRRSESRERVQRFRAQKEYVTHYVRPERRVEESRGENTKKKNKSKEEDTIVSSLSKTESSPLSDYQIFEKDIFSKWNSLCSSIPTLSKITAIGGTRRRHLKARFMEKTFSNNIDQIFNLIKSSDFLMGKKPGRDNQQPWKASFDWLIDNDNNYLKILEGRYNNKDKDILQIAAEMGVKI